MCEREREGVGESVYVQVLIESRRGHRMSGTRVLCNYKLPDIGAGNSTWVLCKSGKWSKSLSYLSIPGVCCLLMELC